MGLTEVPIRFVFDDSYVVVGFFNFLMKSFTHYSL